jgi:hypothetical protein
LYQLSLDDEALEKMERAEPIEAGGFPSQTIRHRTMFGELKHDLFQLSF